MSRPFRITWGRKGRLLSSAGTALSILVAGLCGLAIIRCLGALL